MIKSYKYKNKTYYLIQLSYIDHQGKRYQPKYRFDQNGQRISSERTAKLLEAHFSKDLISEIEGNKLDISFNEWHSRFLSQIKLSYRRGTVMQYDGDLKKWLP